VLTCLAACLPTYLPSACVPACVVLTACLHVLQLVISEISQSAPMSLQAVKLLAEYMGNKITKVS
jgi:hypothetical protein